MKINLKAKPFYLDDEQIKWVEDTLKSLSTDKKIGQLFHLITYSSDIKYLTYLTKVLGVGGCMMRTMNVDELVETTNRFQELSDIPMLLSGNLEAGCDGVCSNAAKMGCEMALAASDDLNLLEREVARIGKEASACGVNHSFAPIIDIDYNWQNPITNTRTYGSDPDRVARFGETYVKTIQKYGVAATIKHFPGDGRDYRDQHLVASINDMSADDWMATYGNAYKKGIDAGSLTCMVGHILQPAWSKRLNPNLKDEEIKPGLIAEELLNGLLREKLGFNGLIITDSSTMAGIGTAVPRAVGVPLTIAAGCDMFLFTKNLEEDIAFMKKGVEDGVITMERLDDAVTRILATKAALGLNKKKADGSIIVDLENARKVVAEKEARDLAKEIADKSITLVKEEKGVLPLSKEKTPRVLVYGLTGSKPKINIYRNVQDIGETVVNEFNKRGYKATLFAPKPGFEGMVDPVSEIIDNYDVIVYAASYQTKSNQTCVRIEWAEPFGANVPVYMSTVPTIFVSFENPYHLVDVPRVRTYINTYGGTQEIIDSLFDKLEGKSPFKGKSPVDAFCGKWDTHLQ